MKGQTEFRDVNKPKQPDCPGGDMYILVCIYIYTYIIDTIYVYINIFIYLNLDL